MRSIHHLLGSAVATGVLLATVVTGAAAQSSPAGGGLQDTDWLLATVGTTPVPSGTNANLLLLTDDAGGFAGCNHFFGSYQSDGASTLTFGPLATTMMACDEATTAFESSYLAALASVASYAIDADTLTLASADGTAVLTFGATAPASVEGPWNVTGINNGKEAVVTPIDGFSPSFAFLPDGTIDGFGGCNNFSGPYIVDGGSIAIGPLMSTMMACDEAVNTQESQLLIALQNATTWSVSAGALELRDDTGALQVGATSAIGH